MEVARALVGAVEDALGVEHAVAGGDFAEACPLVAKAGAGGGGKALLERVEPDDGLVERTGGVAGEEGVADGVEFEAGAGEGGIGVAAGALVEAGDFFLEFAGVGHGEFGGGAGSWGALVGGEVGDGEIDFVADGGDDWDRARGDGAGDGFLVEAPKVFERATTAADDEEVARGVAGCGRVGKFADGAGNLVLGPGTLDADREEDGADPGGAAGEDVEDVLDGGSGGRGDEADGGGKTGQRYFPGGIEEAFGIEFALECLEAGLEVATAGGFGFFDDDLELAAGLVNGGFGEDADEGAVFEGFGSRSPPGTEHGALDLGAAILEREIPVAAGLLAEVGDLTLDPDLADVDFERVADSSQEPGDGDGARFGIPGLRAAVHGNDFAAGWRADQCGSRGQAGNGRSPWVRRALVLKELMRLWRHIPVSIIMKSALYVVTALVLPLLVPAGADAADVTDLYRIRGADTPVGELIEDGSIVVGQRMGSGPVPGARVVVNHRRLEELTGRLPDMDRSRIRGIQHFSGHGNRRNMDIWGRWYQEDGNTQVFRVHEGDWQFRDPDPDDARPGRIEAYTNSTAIEEGTWLEWEGTITIIEPHAGVMFQLFHEGPQLWSFHLLMGSNGDINFHRRRDEPGKERRILVAENRVGRPIRLKVRSNARDYEIYKKEPMSDGAWEFVTDGSYQRGRDNKVQFRWGWYMGQRPRGGRVRNDAMYFVSGTTVRTSSEGPRRDRAVADEDEGVQPVMRTWTDVDGREIRARLRGLDDETAEIIREDGRVFRVPFDRLSDMDLDYLKRYEDDDDLIDF